MTYLPESETRRGPGANVRVDRPAIRPQLAVTNGNREPAAAESGRALVFLLGIAVGAVAAAAVSLLLAPQSGAETRAAIRRRAREVVEGAGERWDEARDELAWSTRQGRKRLQRGLRKGAWLAEDVLDRGRRRAGLL